jgi:biopolymer transport protein ExbD
MATDRPAEAWDLGELDLEFNSGAEAGSRSSAAARPARGGPSASRVALPVVPSRDWDAGVVAEGEGGEDAEAEEEFTLARNSTHKIEELDLAPMVDVAFQLVLFFMVTATTVLYKTLEVPKPSPEAPAESVAQGKSRTLDDFKDEHILVQIDAAGAIQIDHEPVAADMNAIVERLRSARDATRRTSMLLSADYNTMHRNAVLAYDAANEIGLSIAIARPAGGPQGPAPTLFPPANNSSPSPNPNPAPATSSTPKKAVSG